MHRYYTYWPMAQVCGVLHALWARLPRTPDSEGSSNTSNQALLRRLTRHCMLSTYRQGSALDLTGGLPATNAAHPVSSRQYVR